MNPQPLTNLIFPSRKQKYQTLLSYISNMFFFNWRIMASQYCVDFCHTITWLSFKYTYVLPFLNFPPIPQPSRPSHSTGLGSLCPHGSFPRLSLFTCIFVYICPCHSLSPSHPLRPLLCSKSVLWVCGSVPALANEWIKKLWYIIYNGLSLTHKKEHMWVRVKRIKRELGIQSEVSQKKKNKLHILIRIYGRYKDGIDKPQFFFFNF